MTKANTQSQQSVAQNELQGDDRTEFLSDEVSTPKDSSRTKRALSKREIMEQLSRERFPWDE
jgi:hypothetical protein